METDLPGGAARITLRLDPDNGQAAGMPERPRPVPGRRLTIMLDPGHGGVDPGAVRGDVHEADIALAFARELREALRRDGRFDVEMTRDADLFVSLEARIVAARAAGADVFLSIHADAVPEGLARGAQVWTLAEEATSRAGALLAERHDRTGLIGGLDLSGQDDAVAGVLMDLARAETTPRTDALADALIHALRAAEIRLHPRPRERAAFSVLKAPDIPSVLVEIGFMSSPGELELLQSPEWRRRAAAALADGLIAWAEADALR
jgi:N-acetylmuramoyl-L-alanine amidase